MAFFRNILQRDTRGSRILKHATARKSQIAMFERHAIIFFARKQEEVCDRSSVDDGSEACSDETGEGESTPSVRYERYSSLYECLGQESLTFSTGRGVVNIVQLARPRHLCFGGTRSLDAWARGNRTHPASGAREPLHLTDSKDVHVAPEWEHEKHALHPGRRYGLGIGKG